MRHSCRILFAGLMLGAVLSTGSPVEAGQPGDQKQVLVLYSTRRDTQIVATGERELPRILEKGLGSGFDYYVEFIDRARFPDQLYKDAFADFLLKKYDEHHFDVVITVQDVAFEFVSTYRHELFPDVPLVFAVNTPVTAPLKNATGVVTAVDFAGTLLLAARLQPDLRNVFVVSGAEGSDLTTERSAMAQFAPFADRLSITYLSGLTTSELESRLARLPPRSMVYYLLVNQDGSGEFFNPLDYVDRVVEASNAPVYSWVDSTMGRGVVGGQMRTQARVMEEVGGVALRVLRGEPADAIPVVSAHVNLPQVDARQLARWRIGRARVPPGTAVMFDEPSAWDRYKVQIVAGLAVLLAQTALITGLLVQRARRRRAEAHVRRSEAELRTTYDRIRDLGGRLLQAQETERTRIARELHDDISQQLALLTVDLETLHEAPEAEVEELTAEVLGRTRIIARSVHALSHRLHPARLRLIGLVAALQALQREMAQPGVTIEFTHHGVPPRLHPDLTVSLFRIVQEGVGNALKYSRAHGIRVGLQSGGHDLHLTISDDGVGFDVPAMWGKGIGLISMRERVEALGGTLEITSNPGDGTRLCAKVPLRSAPAAATA